MDCRGKFNECSSGSEKLSTTGARKATEVEMAVTDAMADSSDVPKRCRFADLLNCPGFPHPLELQDICQAGTRRKGQDCD